MKVKKYKELILLTFLSLIINFSTINNYPVLDRDEARYAQSTKQMLETGNYKSIKFQNSLRSKKPVGIYWLQAITVNILSHQIFERDSSMKYNKIWKYRLVSSLFSFLSCLALFLIGSKVFGKNRAFYASIILNCTLLFIIEAHIAKTDSVLLSFSIISMVLLCGYYKGIFIKKYDPYFFLLWICIGFSLLIKGPVLAFMIILFIAFIVCFKRKIIWTLNTNPLAGFLILIIMIMPWFLSISFTEQSSFINQGLKEDLLNKIIAVQEGHGAFFGAHTISILLLFFPMSLILLQSILWIIKESKSDDNFLLLAWVLPNLFILELIPTKLPHYSLPLYPALALLSAGYLASFDNYQISNKKININVILSNILYFFSFSVFLFFILKSIKQFSSTISYYNLIIFLLFLLYLASILINLRLSKVKSMYYQVFIACITSFFIFGFLLPKLDKLWISKNILEALKQDNINLDSDYIATIGYNEPSLIFTLGTNTKILSSLQEDFFEKKLYNYIIVEKKYLNDFKNLFKNKQNVYVLLDEFKGFNMAKNKWVSTAIFKLK